MYIYIYVYIYIYIKSHESILDPSSPKDSFAKRTDEPRADFSVYNHLSISISLYIYTYTYKYIESRTRRRSIRSRSEQASHAPTWVWPTCS